jgi:predicted nucleotidyltransferase
MGFRPGKLIDSKIKQKLLGYILHDPFTATTSGLARLAKLPVMTVLRALVIFEDAGLVNRRKVGTAFEWNVNKGSYAYRAVVGIYRSMQEAPGPLEELKKIIRDTIPAKAVAEVKLFGSLARGDYKTNSDIDLFVLVKSGQNKEKFEKYGNELDKKTIKLFGKPVMTYILTEKEFKEKSGLAVIRNIKKEGVRLI